MAKELNKKQEKEPKVKKNYGKDIKSELKKVVWPKPGELAKSTLSVIAIVVFIVAIVFCLDFVFESMNKYGVDKIKDAVQTTEEQSTDANETTDSEESVDAEEATDSEQNADGTVEGTETEAEENVQE